MRGCMFKLRENAVYKLILCLLRKLLCLYVIMPREIFTKIIHFIHRQKYFFFNWNLSYFKMRLN